MRDLRKYARQTNLRIAVGALFLLFVVGDGLIYFIYGGGPALMGLLCLGAGMIPILLVVLILYIIDRIARHANPD